MPGMPDVLDGPSTSGQMEKTGWTNTAGGVVKVAPYMAVMSATMHSANVALPKILATRKLQPSLV